MVGAPDTPKWNSVLFGGENKTAEQSQCFECPTSSHHVIILLVLPGLIGSMFSLLQFISSPLIGAASDVYGRRPLLLLCLVTNYFLLINMTL